MLMRHFPKALLCSAALAFPATAAHAQAVTLWNNAGTLVTSQCLGNSFLICTQWKAWLDGNTMHFYIKNLSDQAPANNTNSAITFIGLGGGVPDPETVTLLGYTGTGQWTLSKQDVNGFAGWGIVNKTGFGVADGNGDPQLLGLTDETWVEFQFSFSQDVSFTNAVVAVHDQGGPQPDCSAKAVWKAVDGTDGSTGGVVQYSDPNDPHLAACMGGSSVPEPASIALLGTGFAGTGFMGLVGMVRRRKRVS